MSKKEKQPQVKELTKEQQALFFDLPASTKSAFLRRMIYSALGRKDIIALKELASLADTLGSNVFTHASTLKEIGLRASYETIRFLMEHPFIQKNIKKGNAFPLLKGVCISKDTESLHYFVDHPEHPVTQLIKEAGVGNRMFASYNDEHSPIIVAAREKDLHLIKKIIAMYPPNSRFSLEEKSTIVLDYLRSALSPLSTGLTSKKKQQVKSECLRIVDEILSTMHIEFEEIVAPKYHPLTHWMLPFVGEFIFKEKHLGMLAMRKDWQGEVARELLAKKEEKTNENQNRLY